MKTVRIHQKNFFINVRGLIVIYLLLCILTVLFSRIYFIETLEGDIVPDILSEGILPFGVFLTIPLVLLIFLAVSVGNLIRDLIAQRIGSKFQVRLLAYFIVVVIFAAVPVTVITTQASYEMVQFWRQIHLEEVLDDAQRLALDNYSMHSDRCEALVKNRYDRIDTLIRSAENIPDGTDWRQELLSGIHRHIDQTALSEIAEEFVAVQDFWLLPSGKWQNATFAGDTNLELLEPPGFQSGFAPRELGRDRDIIRYVLTPDREESGYFEAFIRVVSYNLGEGFDDTVASVVEKKARFDTIGGVAGNLQPMLIFYYGMFFFPTLLMTVIVAISFSRRVTQPLVELAEATRRVAAGDFSIQILARRGDELATLIRSFNIMVQDLQKSQDALVKAEKVSLWQTVAQQFAHEIKNPLTPIRLSAERVLRRWQNDPGRIGEILENSMMAIIQEVEGLSHLLTEFRTLSRPIEPSQTWTVLKDAIEECIAPYRNSYPRVQFDTAHLDPEARIKMDARHINQVLSNLIINAVDSMERWGIIEIRSDLVKKRESRFCRLSIQDSGKGIPEKNREKVFTPYFTTKDSGTGLGLPIVERIVNDYGGSIWFNSAEGAGTTFFIDFPLDEIQQEVQNKGDGSL
ncbi:MAG: HAMP domain-containing protein [Spirochaetaceae bacterium]|jgi:nitrogen fixation/metabolism regulation signal transduction histidine kinase|nr:HAMP domain-containing protein [Spirochaetaceae bacterium]